MPLHLSNFLIVVRRWMALAVVVLLFVPLKVRLFGPAIFARGDFVSYEHGFFYASDVFLLSVFVISLVLWLVYLHAPVTRLAYLASSRWHRLSWIILALAVAVTVSTIMARDPLVSMYALVRAMGWIVFVVLLRGDRLFLSRAMRLFLFMMIGEVVLGVLQAVRGASVGLPWLGEPVVSSVMPGVAHTGSGVGAVLRAYGTFPHPNVFAGYLIVALFVVFRVRDAVSGANVSGASTRCVFVRLLRWGIGLIMAIGLAITFSRGAFIGLFAGLLASGVVCMCVARWSVWRRAAVSVFMGLCVVFVFVGGSAFLGGLSRGVLRGAPDVYQRLALHDRPVIEARVHNLEYGLALLRRYPFGVGFGQAALRLQDGAPTMLAPWEYQPPHNVFLLIAVELGLVGFLAVIGLLAHLFWSARRDPLMIGMFTALVVAGMFDHYLVSLYHGQALLAIAALVYYCSYPDFSFSRK